MTKKNWFMILALAVLAGVYVFYFTDWFKPKIIHITSASRVNRMRAARNPAGGPEIIPVTFSFDHQCQPTEITVVPLEAWKTNQNVLPLWHLVAATNDVRPIKYFMYGQGLRGLKPSVPGAHAEPLEPDVTYRLFVTAGNAKGQHDFETKAAN